MNKEFDKELAPCLETYFEDECLKKDFVAGFLSSRKQRFGHCAQDWDDDWMTIERDGYPEDS